MKISTKIKLDTYNCLVTFIITDKVSNVLKSIYDKHKIDEEIDGDAEGLVVCADISNYYLIIDYEFISHNTIAHEIYHAVVRITEPRDVYEEEAQAWVAGHLSGRIYKFLDKKKIKVGYE